MLVQALVFVLHTEILASSALTIAFNPLKVRLFTGVTFRVGVLGVAVAVCVFIPNHLGTKVYPDDTYCC